MFGKNQCFAPAKSRLGEFEILEVEMKIPESKRKICITVK
jgi:hypothetical protein